MKKIYLLLSLLFCVSICYPATLTSITDGDFSDKTTWDKNYVPSSGDRVIISHNVNLDTDKTIKHLVIDTNSSFSFNSNTLKV